jgi:hypothetical protein
VYMQGPNTTFSATPVATCPVGDGPTGLVSLALGNTITRPSIDLVAISPVTGFYTLLTNKNDGSGTFTPVVNGPTANYFAQGTPGPSTTPQLLTADLNGDGWAELINTFETQGFLPSTGVFRKELYTSMAVDFRTLDQYRPGYAPGTMALDDFDRDGTKDVVVTNPSGNTFTVCWAQRYGLEQRWNVNTASTQASGGVRPLQVATGDVNGDFLPDIAVAQEGSRNIMLFLNLKNKQFGSQVPYALSAAPQQVLLADLNQDSAPEMLVLTADNKLQIFPHTGALDATRYGPPLQIATGSMPTTMQVVDINGDQRPDVVVGCTGDNTVRIYLNQSAVLATRPAQLVGIDVFPNPATDQLTVHRPSTLPGPLTGALLDGLGRLVRQLDLPSATATIPLTGLPRGVYVLRLCTKEAVMSQRVVIN